MVCVEPVAIPGASRNEIVLARVKFEMELPGLAVKVVSASDKTVFQGLKYDKMMKTYTGNVSLLESGEYKLSVLVESSAVAMP